ncbi:hypothetical protein M404DRAFT_30451 [Pisolithus tinctorius Marx 270]|uniref:Myb/SANT-like DNA-binding domain-containing protein n=1 Tax=Pisolithus tinctorius Marx 270 TaxID=870435 RepID=A0A0C3NE73_PISTI|nr:hypothetical protein M404DRAFT_30451 [Pisolithus tinctorius Marx 270]
MIAHRYDDLKPVIACITSATLCIIHVTGLLVLLESDQESEMMSSHKWTDPETHALLDYLIEHWSEQGDTGNFKSSVFSSATAAVTPPNSPPTRTAQQVQNKWRWLKGIYNSIKGFIQCSGSGSWDEHFGANIVTPAEENVWNSYVATNVHCPLSSSNINTSNMNIRADDITPSGGAQGANAYAPSEAPSSNWPTNWLEDEDQEMWPHNFDEPSNSNIGDMNPAPDPLYINFTAEFPTCFPNPSHPDPPMPSASPSVSVSIVVPTQGVGTPLASISAYPPFPMKGPGTSSGSVSRTGKERRTFSSGPYPTSYTSTPPPSCKPSHGSGRSSVQSFGPPRNQQPVPPKLSAGTTVFGLTGAVNHMTDLLSLIYHDSTNASAASPAPAPAPAPAPTIQHGATTTDTVDYLSKALTLLSTEDSSLPVEVGAFMVHTVTVDEKKAMMYASITNPTLRQAVANQEYQRSIAGHLREGGVDQGGLL